MRPHAFSLTASEDGTIKLVEVGRSTLVANVQRPQPPSSREGASAAVAAPGAGGKEAAAGGVSGGAGGGVEIVSRQSVQGERQEQLGAALRCLATVALSY